MPGQIQPLGPVFLGTDAVFPTVAGHKVAAGIPDNGDIHFLHQFQSILPETLLVSQGTIRLVDAAVNGTAQMFNEGTVDSGVDFADLEILVDV